MTYDWDEKIRNIIVKLVIFLLVNIPLGILFLGVLHSLPAFLSGLTATILYLLFLTIIDFTETNTDKYKKLRDMAQTLAENGNPELKKEIKKLIRTQGKIKRYQYDRLINDFESLEKDLVIKTIRGSA